MFRDLSHVTVFAMAKKVKEVAAILEDHGWALARQSGSHRTYKHPSHPNRDDQWSLEQHDVRGMLTSVRRMSGIEELR